MSLDFCQRLVEAKYLKADPAQPPKSLFLQRQREWGECWPAPKRDQDDLQPAEG